MSNTDNSPDIFHRSEILFGEKGMASLKNARILVLGMGGVGGYLTEALARGGIGHITVVDGDVFEETNLNRQLGATCDTLGISKVRAMEDRMRLINPQLDILGICEYFTEEKQDILNLQDYDYVADAIDMVSAKIQLIKLCLLLNIPIISAMGTGNRISPSRLKIGRLNETSGCPLAKAVRKGLKGKNTEFVKVVFSENPPEIRNSLTGSTSYIPGIAGLMMAGEIIHDIVK